jgi:hypothetical protein
MSEAAWRGFGGKLQGMQSSGSQLLLMSALVLLELEVLGGI